jgi:hypothetical protein
LRLPRRSRCELIRRCALHRKLRADDAAFRECRLAVAPRWGWPGAGRRQSGRGRALALAGRCGATPARPPAAAVIDALAMLEAGGGGGSRQLHRLVGPGLARAATTQARVRPPGGGVRAVPAAAACGGAGGTKGLAVGADKRSRLRDALDACCATLS